MAGTMSRLEALAEVIVAARSFNADKISELTPITTKIIAEAIAIMEEVLQAAEFMSVMPGALSQRIIDALDKDGTWAVAWASVDDLDDAIEDMIKNEEMTREDEALIEKLTREEFVACGQSALEPWQNEDALWDRLHEWRKDTVMEMLKLVEMKAGDEQKEPADAE